MNITIMRLLVLFICLVLSKPSLAQSKNTIAEKLTVAVNNTSYPYHFKNENGQADGVMVDMWKLWAEKQRVKVSFVISDWQQTLDSVKDGNVDIHAGMATTQDRKSYLNFTSPFFELNSFIHVHRDFPNIQTIDQLMPFNIGVVANSSHVEQLTKLYPKLKLTRYKSRFAMFDAALSGEVAAFANLDKLSNRYTHYEDIKVEFPAHKRIMFHRGYYVAATAKSNLKLHEFVEQGFEKITNDEKSAIEKKWLGVDKKNDTLSLIYTPELPPYMEMNRAGEPQGLFIDIWRLWAQTTGTEVEFIPQSMSDAIEIINQGGADIHIAFPQSAKIGSELLRAQQIYSVASNVYVSNKLPNIDSLSQLSGKTVGVFDTAPYKNLIIQQYPEVNVVTFKHFGDMFQAVELGTLDAIVGAVENMNAQLVLTNLRSQYYSFTHSPFSSDIYALTQQGNTRLAEIIREGFSLLPTEKLIQLEKRWLSDTSNSYFKMNASKVALTSNEQTFLAAHKEIKIGINNNWKPVEFKGSTGSYQGINVDINKLIEQRTGIKFTYIGFDSWNEMMSALTKRQIDIVASASPNEERTKSLVFSDSYWDMPWVAIHPKQEVQQLNIQDFYGKVLAVAKGYYIVNPIRQAHPNITLRIVENHEEGMVALQRGLVDGVIENIASASELLKRESLMTLGMSVIDEFDVDVNSFAIRKDWPELKAIIDKAISTITESEKQEIYEKWFDIKIETGFDKNTVLRLSVQMGIAIVVILTVIIIWNRRLYREIQMRKSLEEKMKHMATHDTLTGLANRNLLKDRINTAINFHQRQSLQMAVLFIDLDGFKTINDTYGHDVGDELLIQVAHRLSSCVRKSDTIVRFGGDEFVLLLTGLHNKQEAAFIGDKVLKLVQKPFELSVVNTNIGCSIGIAMYPDDGKTDTDLLKEADTLMYQVKAEGKNHYVFNQNNDYR